MNINLIKAVAKHASKIREELAHVKIENKQIIATDSYSMIIVEDRTEPNIPDGFYPTKELKKNIIIQKPISEYNYPEVSRYSERLTNDENKRTIKVNPKLLREMLQSIETIQKQYGEDSTVEISITSPNEPLQINTPTIQAFVMVKR
jgi:hypothetical protein